MHLSHTATQWTHAAKHNWPMLISGAVAWVLILAATLPGIIDIIKHPGFAPTQEDFKEAPDLSSVGSSMLQPLTGDSGIQNTLSQPVTINQGDYIDVGISRCTVGYIDHASNRIYLAGHCMPNGSYYARKDNKPLGKFVTSTSTGRLSQSIDVGYIIPHDKVTLGANTYTGDNIVAKDDITVGETLCSYGGRSKTTVCALIDSINAYTVYTKGTASGGSADMQSGDSGGPAWILNSDGSIKGFVGFNSHITGDGQTGKVGFNGYSIFDNFLRQ